MIYCVVCGQEICIPHVGYYTIHPKDLKLEGPICIECVQKDIGEIKKQIESLKCVEMET